jgi:hypothetical protein
VDNSTFSYVQAVINNEGFGYAFMHYDNFKQVKDKKFHTLRKAYLKAQKALESYVNEHIEED